MTEKTIEYWNSRPEIYEMSYENFLQEYSDLLPIMEKKEGLGNLDFNKPGYIPMTDEEIALHEKDWRAFSRLRGYSEYDIAEYGRWHKLTGQTDGLMPAINDPWRRPRDPALLYVQHLDYALERGILLSEKVQKDYDDIKHRDDEDPLSKLFQKSQREIPVDDDFDFDVFFEDSNTKIDANWDGWDDNIEWQDKYVPETAKATPTLKKQVKVKISSLKKRLSKPHTPRQKMTLALWKKMREKTPAD